VVVTVLVVVGVGVALAVFTARFLGITSFSPGAVAKAVADANEATQGEGSGFESSHDTWNPSPLYFPVDVYLVLFKPLPFEVASSTQAFAAVENLTIIGLIAWSWRSLASVPGRLRESPFIVMCLFSALGNVGLLARERTLLFPFLFVLFALPDRPPRRRAGGSQRSGARDSRVSALLR
jgi:hypothetical protein